MRTFIILALLFIPSISTAQTFSVTSDPELTNSLKSQYKDIQCGTGVCINVRQDCPVTTIFTRNIVNGATGLDVVSLQDFLVKQGVLVMPKTAQYGTFGPTTATALMKYQKTNGLLQTGVVDDTTRAHLNNLVTQKKGCFTYYRPDQLDIVLSKKPAYKALAQDLNSNGYTSAFGQLFCTLNTKGGCVNITKVKAFTMYVPSKLGIVRSATHLKSQASNFSIVSYVPALKSQIQFKAPTFITTYIDTPATTTETVQKSGPAEYNYTFTVPTRTGTVTDVQEIEALLSIDLVSLDSNLYGTWKLERVNGISYSKEVDDEITMTANRDPKTIEIIGCGKVSGTLFGTVGVIKIQDVKTELKQCMSQGKVLKQGEIFQSLLTGVRFTVTETRLVLTSGSGTILEFSRK
jgi:hypothetical protein